jgi:hypothetical protein
MRFQKGLSVTEIAAATGADPRRLYRRLTTLLRLVRARLEAQKVSGTQVRPLLGHPELVLAAWSQPGAAESA